MQTSNLLYGADGAGGQASNLYILDSNTGAVIQTVGPIGFPVTGLAVHPRTGELFGVTSGQPSNNPGRGILIRIDELTGGGIQIGDTDPDITNTVADITFAPDGTLFGWLEDTPADGDDLVTIDLATGLASVVDDSGLDTAGSGLAAFDSNTLFLAGEDVDDVLSSISASSGLETTNVALNGYSGAGNQINAMDFNASGILYGALIDQSTRATELITINTTTGAVTTLGASVDRLDAIAFAEPETCDDGNIVSGDGCSNDCKTVETGFTCPQPGQPCQAICGDESVDGTEVCDDGNTVSGDGCSSDCRTVESGYTCPAAGGPCEANGALTGSGCSLSSAVSGGTSLWVGLASSLSLLWLKRRHS